MKQFTLWMRQVMPPKWFTLLLAGCYFISIVVTQFVLYWFDLYDIQEETGLAHLPSFCLSLFAMLYGCYRCFAFHPIYQDDYREWLAQTPWSYTKPLPRGPLFLVAQDFLILGIISLLSYCHSSEHWHLTPALFFTAHYLMCLISFLLIRKFRSAYVLTFVFSSLLYFHAMPVLLLISVAIMSIISHLGLRESLLTFDKWSGEIPYFLQTNNQTAKELARNNTLGWPYDLMGPVSSPAKPNREWTIAIALLTGWWSFSVIQQITDGPEFLWLMISIGLWVVSFVPTSKCLSGHASPINIWGRIRTGRWIIPGYDKIFLSPLVVGFFLALSACLAIFSPQAVALNSGITAMLSVFFTIYLSPDLNEWRLTGHHRISPGFGINMTELVQTQ